MCSASYVMLNLLASPHLLAVLARTSSGQRRLQATMAEKWLQHFNVCGYGFSLCRLSSTVCAVQKGRLTLTATRIFAWVFISDPILTLDVLYYYRVLQYTIMQVLEYWNDLKCPSLIRIVHFMLQHITTWTLRECLMPFDFLFRSHDLF